MAFERALEAEALKALNVEIMLQLQEQGIAVLSDATVHGQHCLRAAINHHRTQSQDLQRLVDEVARIGEAVVASGLYPSGKPDA